MADYISPYTGVQVDAAVAAHIASGSPSDFNMSTIVEATTARVATDGDLSGNNVLYFTNAAATTYTINTGLVGTEPLTIIQKGAGQVTITAGAGVTINSADGAVATRVQYSSATLIPDPAAADLYTLIGDLA